MSRKKFLIIPLMCILLFCAACGARDLPPDSSLPEPDPHDGMLSSEYGRGLAHGDSASCEIIEKKKTSRSSETVVRRAFLRTDELIHLCCRRTLSIGGDSSSYVQAARTPATSSAMHTNSSISRVFHLSL